MGDIGHDRLFKAVAHATIERAQSRIIAADNRPLGALRPVLERVLAEELAIVLQMDNSEVIAIYEAFERSEFNGTAGQHSAPAA